jgi:putative endonuclease
MTRGEEMGRTHIKTGRQGESAAAVFYEMHDGEILERNWTCSFGEVDLVVLDNGCLVFCEVKTRRSLSAGLPEEQVTKDKQNRYIRCAQLYCESCMVEYDRVRFDVIAVYAHDEMSGEIRFIPHAFGED